MSVTTGETEHVEQREDTARTNVLQMTTAITERLPYFRRIAMRCLNNSADAEDAVQDALLAAWKHVEQFRGQCQISTWLSAIVVNSSRTVIRKRKRDRLLPIDGEPGGKSYAEFSEIFQDQRPDPEAQVRNSEYIWRLHHLSAQLPPALRVVVQLRVVRGLSVRQTAEALGVTVGAVKSRSHRAVSALRRLEGKTSRRILKTPSTTPRPFPSQRNRGRNGTNARCSNQPLLPGNYAALDDLSAITRQHVWSEHHGAGAGDFLKERY